MTGKLINHIGLFSAILFFIGAFLIVRSITYKIEIQEFFLSFARLPKDALIEIEAFAMI